MFGLKKKESMSELPDIPSSGRPSMRDYQRPTLPAIEPLQEEKDEINGLPSFPDSPMNRGFSQSMIKSAVEDEDKNLPELPEWSPKSEEQMPQMNRNAKTVKMEEWRPESAPIPPAPKWSHSEEMQMSNMKDEKRPLFVKLDKFKEARDSLTKISDKLDQMDELLKMIKDVKAKEDEEITSWEKDIENIKMRIAFVNREVFENAY